MGTPPSLSAMFSKGDNFGAFLFAYLENEVFPKWGLLLKIASLIYFLVSEINIFTKFR